VTILSGENMRPGILSCSPSHLLSRVLLTFVLLFSLLIPLFAGDDDTFTPEISPAIAVRRASGKVDIDGRLDDAAWQRAAKIDQFVEFEPGDQTKPPVDTETYVTYDLDNLYVAFVCYDDPGALRATLSERDRWYGNDAVGVLIDTYGNADWAYKFYVNRHGIQRDFLWSRTTGDDDSFDMVWESAGRITDRGYQVEIAIPFSSIRFPNRDIQTWKIDFRRDHPRESFRKYAWSVYDRDDPCVPCQWGDITGIEDVAPGRGIEIVPTFLGFQSGSLNGSGTPDAPFGITNEDPKGEVSLFTRYAPTSNTTLEAALNPDFSQVESDAAQIDVNTTFALFYPEKRPFFLEGSDIFSTWTNTIYTRSINNPLATGKMIGRMQGMTLAYLVARDETTPIILPFEENSSFNLAGKSTSNIVRGRRAYGQDSYVGLIMTDRRLDGGGSGSLLSFDGQQRLSKNFRLQWQMIGTHSEEPNDTSFTPGLNNVTFDNNRHTAGFDGESFFGRSIVANLEERSRHINADVTYWERSPTFRADNGFEPRNNWRKTELYLAYTFYLDNSLFDRIIPSTRTSRIWNFDGDLKNNHTELNIETRMRVFQLSTHHRYMMDSETFGGVNFDNLWEFHTCFNSTPSSLFAFGGSINRGHTIARRSLTTGKTSYLSGWLDVKPADRLLIEYGLDYTRSYDINTNVELYRGYIARTRLSLQILRELSLRMVVEYDDFSKNWNMDPLLTYRINPFSVFYVGSTFDWDQYSGPVGDERGTTTRLSSRQFFMKLQYLFQV